MDLKKPDRATLKSYFIKNALPTQGHFAELIEGLINQRDDGLAKPAGEPLSLQVDGDETGQMKALNFYRSFSDTKPTWTLSLNPRADPTRPATARPGWSLGDADGYTKLFIDQASGNVGIGTAEPGDAKLRVAGSFNATANASGERPLAMEAPANTNHRGSGAQAATGLVYRVARNPAAGEPIFQVRSEGQAVRFFVEHDGWTGARDNSAWFGGARANYFAGNVGIGIAEPAGKLEVVGAVAISNGARASIGGHLAPGALSVGGTTANYGGGTGWNTNTAALMLETAANTEIAVHDAGTRLASLLYYEGESFNRITIGRDMGVGGPIGRVVVASDLEVTGAVYARKSNPLWHRMYPSDPLVYQDIFDAKDARAIQKRGSGTYDETSYNTPQKLWYDRRIICFGNDNEADGNGAQITIPAGYETVWVRVLGDRWAHFKAFLDGEDLGFWAGGYRSANGYCPDGSLSDGNNDWEVGSTGGKRRVDVHQWVPIAVPRSGTLALVPKTNNQSHFWLSGLAFSRNPWKHAANPANLFYWKSNGGKGVDAAPSGADHYDWNQDVLGRILGKTDNELAVPVAPSGRDKLVYIIEHNNSWNGCSHGDVTVNGTKVERFMASYDNPFARHWSSKIFERYIAVRVPANLIKSTDRWLKLRIDMSKTRDQIHFREIGTHDLEVPLG